ncbi:MAG: DUF86 domain-containing protein [Thiotrichaceae bacterium]
MDRDVITEKLESLRRCIKRIEDKRPENLALLNSNIDLQDIIVLNLTRAIQTCVDIGAHIIAGSEENPPATMGETFDTLAAMGIIDSETSTRMRKAVGFRNIAVHGYDEIDFAIVYSIITKQMIDFQQFAKSITTTLTQKK